MNAEERAEQRRATLGDYHESGLTQKEFCRSRGVARSTLGYWLKQERRSSDSQQAFVQVAAPKSTGPANAGGLRVHIRNSVTLEIDLPVDEKQLTEILKAAVAI